MNSNIKKIIVIALILSVAAAASIYAQPVSKNWGVNSQGATSLNPNYDPNNPNCRANGGTGMGQGYGSGYGRGRSRGRNRTGGGCVGCSQSNLSVYQKYAGNPEFRTMLREKDTLRLKHQQANYQRRNSHRVEMRNLTLDYSAKINSAKTSEEKTRLTNELNSVLAKKRTAHRTESLSLRNQHRKQVTSLESKYTGKFPEYFSNRANYNSGRRGSGCGRNSGNGRNRGNGRRNKGNCSGC